MRVLHVTTYVALYDARGGMKIVEAYASPLVKCQICDTGTVVVREPRVFKTCPLCRGIRYVSEPLAVLAALVLAVLAEDAA